MAKRFDLDIALAYAPEDSATIELLASPLKRAGVPIWEARSEVPYSANSVTIQENLERTRTLLVLYSANVRKEDWAIMEANLVRFRRANQDGRHLVFLLKGQTDLPQKYRDYPSIRVGDDLTALVSELVSLSRNPGVWERRKLRGTGAHRSVTERALIVAQRVRNGCATAVKAAWLWVLSFFVDDAYCELAEMMWSDRLGRWIIKGLLQILVFISPNFDEVTNDDERNRLDSSWTYFWFGYTIAMMLCLVGCAIGCMLQGTYESSNPKAVVSFVSDRYNLLLYAFVCPLYTGCCFAIINLATKYWQFICSEATRMGVPAPVAFHIDKRRKLCAIALLAIFTVACTTNYINGILRIPMNKPWVGPKIAGSALTWPAKYYWFTSPSLHGTPYLNAVGWYYAFINAMLLFVTVFGVMSYYSLSFEVIRLARVRDWTEGSPSEYLGKLNGFKQCYVLARVLVLAYAINIFLWAFSPLGSGTQQNLLLANFMLWLLTGHLFSFPINLVERSFSAIETQRVLGREQSSQRKVAVDFLYRTHRNVDKVVSRLCGLFVVGFGVYEAYSVVSSVLKALVG